MPSTLAPASVADSDTAIGDVDDGVAAGAGHERCREQRRVDRARQQAGCRRQDLTDDGDVARVDQAGEHCLLQRHAGGARTEDAVVATFSIRSVVPISVAGC